MTQAPIADELRADLLHYETRVWQALQDGDAVADFDLLLPSFLGVYPSGFSDKNGHTDQLADGPSIVSYELSHSRAFAVGEGHAMLCYRARFRRVGQTEDQLMYVSSLWQRVGQEWRNLFSQDTPALEVVPD